MTRFILSSRNSRFVIVVVENVIFIDINSYFFILHSSKELTKKETIIQGINQVLEESILAHQSDIIDLIINTHLKILKTSL